MYHGNADMNMVSQVDLLIGAKESYSHLYRDSTGANVNLDPNAEPGSKSPDQSPFSLLPAFTNFDEHMEYKAGVHFNRAMLTSPVKSKLHEQCSGRFLLELSRAAIANIKKASVIADKWSLQNDTPSGTI